MTSKCAAMNRSGRIRSRADIEGTSTSVTASFREAEVSIAATLALEAERIGRMAFGALRLIAEAQVG